MRRISLLIILVFGLVACAHKQTAELGKTQFLDPALNNRKAIVLPPAEPAAKPPVVERNGMRDFCEQCIFASFKFKGTLGEAIRKLMNDSSKLNPEGMAVGGFAFFGNTDNLPVDVDSESINAADLIDLLCAEVGVTYEITSHSIVIRKPKSKVQKASSAD